MSLNLFSFIPRFKRNTLLFLALATSYNVLAKNSEQTLIMMGSSIQTCTTLSPQFCKVDASLSSEKSAHYALTDHTINRLKQHWPTANTNHLNATVSSLTKLVAHKHSSPLSKRELLWAWRDTASLQMSELSQAEFEYVIDMLQVPQSDGQNRVFNIDSGNSKNDQSWLSDTFNFLAASLKVKAAQPTLLIITAAGRDPYADADYYETVLSQTGVAVQWLALTPALATAINQGKCEQLDTYRNKNMALYNRQTVYPKRVAAEQRLCVQGVAQLTAQIKNSTGVMLVGGEHMHNLHASFFDSKGKAYPWLEAIADAPVLAASSDSVRFLAPIYSQPRTKAENSEDVLAALRGGESIVAKGLGSFHFGRVSSHFSEQNRSTLLGDTLQNNQPKTAKSKGFGIDEYTTLVVIKSSEADVITVLGDRGVVHLSRNSQQQYNYSYWPVGAVIEMQKGKFKLSQRSIDNALPTIKIPALPMQRFSNILSDAKLRSLTQAMCLSEGGSAVGQQDEFLVTLSAQSQTRYHRLNTTRFGCAIEQLSLGITRF